MGHEYRSIFQGCSRSSFSSKSPPTLTPEIRSPKATAPIATRHTHFWLSTSFAWSATSVPPLEGCRSTTTLPAAASGFWLQQRGETSPQAVRVNEQNCPTRLAAPKPPGLIRPTETRGVVRMLSPQAPSPKPQARKKPRRTELFLAVPVGFEPKKHAKSTQGSQSTPLISQSFSVAPDRNRRVRADCGGSVGAPSESSRVRSRASRCRCVSAVDRVGVAQAR